MSKEAKEDLKIVEYNNSIYANWINTQKIQIGEYNKQNYEPLISVVIPVYNVVDEQLIECIESVCNQTYKKWELYLVDDNSTWESVRDILKRYENDEKINIIYRKENGNISVATNDGIFASHGEYIAFMDCDDTIERNALAEMVYYLNKNPDTDFVYSDEDKLSEDGMMYHSPFFKPDWSPDTFFSIMYTNHLALYRRELVCKTGGLRTEYNGSQDYDFTLRFMELSDNNKVGHVSKVLYHWREREESTASGISAKPYVLEVVKRLKEDAIQRRNINARVEFVSEMYQYNIVYGVNGKTKVSIIIPSKDNLKLLKQCIGSLMSKTTYTNYELIVVDNGSNDSNKFEIKRYLNIVNAKYIYSKMDFNFSKMCNIGADNSSGDYLLFLNDDVEITKGDWLGVMLGQAMQPHTGAVGAKLLYPDSTMIQHIGVTNLAVGPSHMCMGLDDENEYYFGRNRVTYNWLAVTGACLMVDRKKFIEVKGFDENLSVAYNDIDLCFKLHEKGYYNASRMDALLYHHESFSRGYDNLDEKKMERLKVERGILFDKHPELFAKDPYYNTNLEVNSADFSIKKKGLGIRNYGVMLDDNSYPIQESGLKLNIDEIYLTDNAYIRGWAISSNPENDLDSKRFLLLKNKAGQLFRIAVRKDVRTDISDLYKIDNYTEGFKCRIDRKLLVTDMYDYEIGLLQVDASGKEEYVWSNKKLPRDGIGGVEYVFYSRKIDLSTLIMDNSICCSIDKFYCDDNVVTPYGGFKEMTYLEGWAFVPGKDSCDYRIEIGVVSEDNKEEIILHDTIRGIRCDVAGSCPNENCYLSGFKTEIPCKIEVGEEVYIVLADLKSGELDSKRIIL